MQEINNKHYLFTDGNRFPKINKAGFGGYIQNSESMTLIEFTQEILENENKHNFEILGIIRGLELAKDMDIKNIHCKCDDKTLISHLIECQKDLNHLDNIYGNKKNLIKKCIDITKNFEEITFEYIPRNLNKYSDLLSRKYVSLLEKNYLIEHDKMMEKSKVSFLNNIVPSNSVYYYGENVYVMPHEHNPFIVSQKKNKKQKEFRRNISANFENYWSLDIIYKNKHKSLAGHKLKEIESVSLRKYDEKTNNWIELKNYSVEKLNLNTAIDIYINAVKSISGKEKNLWLNTNIESLQDVFYRKKPISKEIFPKFVTLNNELKSFEKVLFHRIPREIELRLKNKNKKTEKDFKEDKTQTIKLIKQSDNPYKKNKHFGRLLSIILKEMFENTKSVTEEEKDRLKESLMKKYKIKKEDLQK